MAGMNSTDSSAEVNGFRPHSRNEAERDLRYQPPVMGKDELESSVRFGSAITKITSHERCRIMGADNGDVPFSDQGIGAFKHAPPHSGHWFGRHVDA
jgi:hypothetical protein